MCSLATAQTSGFGKDSVLCIFQVASRCFACSVSLLLSSSLLLEFLPLTLCCPRNQVLGAWAWLVPLAVVLSTFGSANGMFFGGSRVCYVAAREGHMVRDGVWAGQGGGGCRRAKLSPA